MSLIALLSFASEIRGVVVDSRTGRLNLSDWTSIVKEVQVGSSTDISTERPVDFEKSYIA